MWAFYGILSSLLPVKTGVLQGSVLVPVLFLIFINDLSDSLENPLYVFADGSNLCCDFPHPSDRQATTSSLSSDLEKKSQVGQTLGICLSILTNISLSLHRDCLANPRIYFLNNHLEEVQSLKLLGLTINHDPSWVNHISKLTSKASRRLGILRRTKSSLGTPELLSTYKAFIHSLMEYCSPFWPGSPASYIARLDAVETRCCGF